MEAISIEFFDLMARGGPVMWVIFVVAWLAFIMLIERFLRISAWRRHAIKDQAAFDQDKHYKPSSDRSPIAKLTRRINWYELNNKDEVAQQLNIQLAELMPKLEGSLPTIAIIGSLLPMLGLLGTVTGMIEVFEVIALQGTGEPQEMAHGISQALLTTASGLIIAIPVIFLHHLLSRRLRYVLAITEQSMHAVFSQDISVYKNAK
ncbi:MAG TPA: MotA/TolQ/ExbB proton channel family protein [Gammaproteobacteria bacterium]|nr:MotA/TolQ/ExbB proton channel family protein [Gammaproteobacteria bacterium]